MMHYGQDVDIDRDSELLRLAREAYTGSSTFFDTNVRQRIIEDIHQFNSEHGSESKYRTDTYKLRNKLFRPKSRTAVMKAEARAAAAYFGSADVASVEPYDDNDKRQQAAAAAHKELLQYRLSAPKPKGMPWFLTCLGAFQDADSVGVCCSIQDWDFNESKGIDRPECTLIPVENFRFDPAADWRDVVESSPYFIILWPMYVKDIKARMPQKVQGVVEVEHDDGTIEEVPGEVWDAEGRNWRYCEDDELRTASMTHDTIRQARDKSGTDSKKAVTSISDFDVVWVHQNFIEVEGELQYYWTLGTHKLLSDARLVKERYPQGHPAVVGFTIIEAHKAYKPSKMQLTRDIQVEINDVTNKRMDNVNLMLNKRYFAKRGNNVDLRSLTRNIPSSVTLMDNVSDVKVITTDDATASSYQEHDRLSIEFDDLCGAFSGSSVQSNRKLNETVGGMNLIADNADVVSEYHLRVFTETWVEPVLRQISMLQQAYEDDETVLNIVGRKAKIHKYGLETLDREILEQETVLKVAVGTGATNQNAQIQRFVYALQTSIAVLGDDAKHDLNVEAIISELFGKSGYKDGKRFFKSLSEEEQKEDPRIQKFTQAIAQLQQQLKAKHPPEVVAAQVDKIKAETRQKNSDASLKDIQAILKRVEALFASSNTAKNIVETPGVTPVADAIAASSGFVDMDADESVFPDVDRVEQEAVGAVDLPENTSPLYPARADSGVLNGVESGEVS